MDNTFGHSSFYSNNAAYAGNMYHVTDACCCNANLNRIESFYGHAPKTHDFGPDPYVVDINKAALQNDAFRKVVWTGRHLQLTLMSIGAGQDIGLEIHPDLDQFIRIESGQGVVMMGDRWERLDFEARVYDDFAFIIPAGKWHNIVNTGNLPLKLYSIYAPPQHPPGTVHLTRAEALNSHAH